ncbi:MAG: metallopeptidase family protein [Gemmatimonadota bacterium]|nr:metallopeptidase family protein [Gemmatimonadota bacterium]MDE3007031.1 metallopeptidase family protein [Gemmatimonadota bacterium]MDE3014763.1 metallopeptidase family protein [Gemmatimonadota bacterium]
MTFEEFERHARIAWREIPRAYKDGVDGLTVRRDARVHPDHSSVYTLGECLTEEHLSDFGSADTTRSIIALYWGSFDALSREDRDFDWEDEIWETLTHELRHHLESLAGDDALEDLDRASEEMFRRFDGQDFDPWYYQHSEVVAPGLFRVEKAWYLEQIWDRGDADASSAVEFEWGGVRYRIPRPAESGDVHFIRVEGIDVDGTFELVLLRRRSWLRAVKHMMGFDDVLVLESEASAEPVRPAG